MTYVMSDIHGSMRRFKKMLAEINFSKDDELYIIGDVIDRNEDGIAIYERIMDNPNIHVIMGNHEKMMLSALRNFSPLKDDNYTYGPALNLWFRNGGLPTLEGFHGLPRTKKFRLMEYLKGLPYNMSIEVNGENYFLVHAAPPELFNKKFSLANNVEEFMIWIRTDAEDEFPKDRTTIFGHSITYHYQNDTPYKIWYGQNRICIDCGSAFPDDYDNPGRLACLCLETKEEFYVS